MAERIPSISLVKNFLSEANFLPVYFLSGDDRFLIEKTIDDIKNAVLPYLESEFDFETYSLNKKEDLTPVLNSASAFPFGTGKKLILIKHFEELKDKKKLLSYVRSPSESTILVVAHFGRIKNVSSQPFAELLKKKFLFQTPYLRGNDLVNWLIAQAKELELSIAFSEAQFLIDTMGDDKTLLESQLQKIREYLNGKGTVTAELIRKLTFAGKEYNVFDFLNMLGKGEKKKAVEILYNLLDNGFDMVYVNLMTAKFISTIAKGLEISKEIRDTRIAARKIGVSEYYYKKCLDARALFNKEKVKNAARALLQAELNVKSTNMDQKAIGLILVSEILS